MRPQLRVFEYDFSLLVKYCQITMRFPCSFSLSWKLEKSTVCDNRKVSLTSNRVEFNSTLRLRAQLPEDGGSCLDKKSFLTVNLNSVSRPDDVKVAGVVTIELSKHINEAIQGDVVCALERCPDKASVICYRLEWTKGREVRLEDYHDCMSLSRLANELSSIGRGPQSELSEQLDLKELQFGTSEKSQDIGNKRINSLTRTPIVRQKNPRVSMQQPPLITELKNQEEEGGGLRKVKSGDSLFRAVSTTGKKDLAESNYIPQAIPPNNDLQRLVESLKQENTALERENDELKKENIVLKKRNNELSTELKDNQKSLQHYAEKELQANKQNQLILEDYIGQIERLNKQLNLRTQKSHDANSLQLLLQQQRQKNLMMQSQLQRLQQRLEQYTQQLVEHNTLVNNYYYLQGECQRLQQQYDHSEQQVWDLTISLKDKEKQISYLQKKGAPGTQGAPGAPEKLEDDYQATCEENQKLRKNLKELEGQLEEQQNMFTTELRELKEMIGQSMVQEESTLDTIEIVKEDYIKMRDVLARRAQYMAFFEARLIDLEREINEINMAKTSRSRERSISYGDSEQTSRVFNTYKTPIEQPVSAKKFDKAGGSQSSIPDEAISIISPQSAEIQRLKAVNKELIRTIQALKSKPEPQEQQKQRTSQLSKKGTQATKQQQHEQFQVSAKIRRSQSLRTDKKQSNINLQLLQTVPEYKPEQQASMLKQKVQIQQKVRQISIQLQKMKLTLMKNSKTTPQIQQLISAMKPLQQRIFQLLSWKKGIMSSGYGKQLS